MIKSIATFAVNPDRKRKRKKTKEERKSGSKIHRDNDEKYAPMIVDIFVEVFLQFSRCVAYRAISYQKTG